MRKGILEVFYLLLGGFILVRGTLDHGLTVEELGAALFCFGLVPVTRADQQRQGEGSDLIREAVLRWLRSKP